MPPELLSFILGLFGGGPETLPPVRANTPNRPHGVERMEAMYNSPYAQDTLAAILGGPLPPLEVDPSITSGRFGTGAPAAGTYSPEGLLGLISELITLNPRLANEDVLTHEVGHAFDRRKINPELFRAVTAKRPVEGSYASTNPNEHFAEAFVEAMDNLRYSTQALGRAPNEVVRRNLWDALEKNLEASEVNVPGTADIFDWLLEHEIFAEHPWRERRKQANGS